MVRKLIFGDYGEMDTAEFGDGDITMSRFTGISSDDKYEYPYQIIAFTESEKKEIFENSPQFIGKPPSALPKPIFIMSFKNPESILSLITVLTSGMEDMYKEKRAKKQA